jgi:hypothetical protein
MSALGLKPTYARFSVSVELLGPIRQRLLGTLPPPRVFHNPHRSEIENKGTLLISATKKPVFRIAIRGPLDREATMNATGAVYPPELIQLMKAVLDEAMATLPEAKRTSVMKAEIASQILACAGQGVRDPIALKVTGLLAVVECTHYSHDISPQRRVV